MMNGVDSTVIVLTIIGLAISVFAMSAECHDCMDPGALCHTPLDCGEGCHCVPLPGRNVGMCQ